MTYIIGIDCATDGTKAGLALGHWTTEHLQLISVEKGTRDLTQQVLKLLSQTEDQDILLAMDAPLGWPVDLGTSLANHQAGDPIFPPANTLFRRETDCFIKKHFNKQSLDVGADRIARTAHAALHLLQVIRQKSGKSFPFRLQPKITNHSGVIEVYPAATLIAYQMPNQGYKSAGLQEHSQKRQQIIDHLKDHMTFQCPTQVMIDSADALDAAICVLAGADFLNGHCYPPQDPQSAAKESWIWTRRPLNPKN